MRISVTALSFLLFACKDTNTDKPTSVADAGHTVQAQAPVETLTPGQDTQETIEPEGQPAPVENPWLRTGKHKLTLQWISWDKPGSVMIEPAENGWYTITGSQKSDEGKDYLRIEGRIMPVSDKELLFEGEVIYSIASINGGEPCVKSGRQTFLSTKGRKYWRLQNMLHCVDGTTDYVDIYF